MKNICMVLSVLFLHGISLGQSKQKINKKQLELDSNNPIANVLVDDLKSEFAIIHLKNREDIIIKGGRHQGCSFKQNQYQLFYEGRLVDFEENEEVISIMNSKLLTQKIDNNELTKELRLYNLDSKRIKKPLAIKCDLQADVLPMNESMNVVVSDNYEGYGTSYIFYDSALNELNKYKPFKSGFETSSLKAKKNKTVIASKEKLLSPVLNITSLNPEGLIIDSINYYIGNDILGCIEIVNNCYIMYQYNIESSLFKLIYFDSDFSTIWEKNLNAPIANNIIEVSEKTNSIFFETESEIIGFDLINQKEKWIKQKSSLNSNSENGLKLEINSKGASKIVEAGDLLFIMHRNFSPQSKTFNEVLLLVLDANNGNLEYFEELNKQFELVDLILMSEKVFFINNIEIYSYEKSN